MKCPVCDKEMRKGVLSGDGRSKVFFESEDEKLGMMDKLCGKGMIDAKYTLSKFEIQADYCDECRKMIFSTGLSK